MPYEIITIDRPTNQARLEARQRIIQRIELCHMLNATHPRSLQLQRQAAQRQREIARARRAEQWQPTDYIALPRRRPVRPITAPPPQPVPAEVIITAVIATTAFAAALLSLILILIHIGAL